MMDKSAFISDCHGNTPGLRAVLEDIERLGFENIYFLGDAVNGVDPSGCIDLLRERKITCIRGNAEECVCTPKVADFPWRDTDDWSWVVPKVTWWQQATGEERIGWIGSWPREMQIDSAWLIHDSPHSRNVFPERFNELSAEYKILLFHGWAMPTEDADPMFRINIDLLQAGGYKTLFCGHSHVASVQRHGDITVCNAGSSGMPLDGDYRPSWAEWNDGKAAIHRVDYDVERILHLIRRSDMPLGSENYGRMFTHGIHWTHH